MRGAIPDVVAAPQTGSEPFIRELETLKRAILELRSVVTDVLTNLKVIPYRRGMDEFRDIHRLLPHERIDMIFDVGANVGDTALAFRRNFPSATIHCFEPNSELAPHLNGLNANLNVHSVALSSRAGESGFNKSGAGSDVYSLTDDKSGEIVALDTVDDFCKSRSIDHIHYLKIDTEGHDLEVLKGASSMLTDFRIDLVQAEVSMNPDNNLHVSFFKVANHLEPLGYRLFGVYEQTNEFPTKKPNLRRSNVLYLSPKIIS
jgi:FkbM family methyltransferase